MADDKQLYFSHRQPKLVVRVAQKLNYGSTKFKTLYGTFYKHDCYIPTNTKEFEIKMKCLTLLLYTLHIVSSIRKLSNSNFYLEI